MYLQRHPNYDRLPRRLGSYIREQYGNLYCVDVGANIGDTLAAFYKHGAEKDRFLAIEPHPLFNKYLYANWGGHNNVKVISCLCSSSNTTEKYKVLEMKGTASIVKTDQGIELESKTLDEIVNDFQKFPCFNVIKIDTDGHDFEVIAGAKSLITACRPAVLFECETSSDSAYVETCLETLNLFQKLGYSEFLLYDNFGYLMGKFSLDDHSAFTNLLFYQLVSKFHYYDILLLRSEDISQFYTSEVAYFIEHMPKKWLQRSARIAAESGS
jgi:FkbM family methyltransferase